MDILDTIAQILAQAGFGEICKGFMPSAPAACIALFQRESPPLQHSFGGFADEVYSLQARIRDATAAQAFETANTLVRTLEGTRAGDLCIQRASVIVSVDRDPANPAVQEYTINFIIRRY